MSFEKIIIPLGLSFCTFQAIGYILDVYSEKHPPENNLFKLALFISFFPQILQGPISRYHDLAPQLYEGHRFDYGNLLNGMQRILWGFFKKLVIADRLAITVNAIFADAANYSGVYCVVAIVMFSIQLYMDFSGGIDIAIGAAQALGITLAENFRQPYFSKSISEFWQRWHCTLGSWMRDYVFLYLSLSSTFTRLSKFLRKRFGKGASRTIPSSLASLVVFFIIGVWHGASWTFIIFGLYHGVSVGLGTMLASTYGKIAKALHIKTNCFSWSLFQMLRTYLLICAAQFFARASTVETALYMLKESLWAIAHPLQSIAELNGMTERMGLLPIDFTIIALSLAGVLFVSILKEKRYSVRALLNAQNVWFRWALYLLVTLCVVVLGAYGAGYDSAAFIYAGM